MTWYDWYVDSSAMTAARTVITGVLSWRGGAFGYAIAFIVLAPLAMAAFNWWRRP